MALSQLATLQIDLIELILNQLKTDSDLVIHFASELNGPVNAVATENSRMIPEEFNFPLIQVKDADVNFETESRSQNAENPNMECDIYVYTYIRNADPEIHLLDSNVGHLRLVGLVLKALYAKTLGGFHYAMPLSISSSEPIFVRGTEDEEEIETILMSVIRYKFRKHINTL